MICDDTGAGWRPSRAQTAASIDGSRWAKVPTAPEIRPTATVARARRSRTTSRCSCEYHVASFRPNVIGSAWTPCVRPIITVCRCSSARRRTIGSSASMSAQDLVGRLDHLQRQRRVDDVGRGQAEVQPARARPDVFRDVGGEGDQVVLGGLLDLVDAGDVEVALGADVPRRLARHEAGLGHHLGGDGLDFEPGFEAAAVAPDATHFGRGVAGDHARSSRSGGSDSPSVSGPSTVTPSEPFEKWRAATRCTSSAVTASMRASVSSSVSWRSK